MEQLAVGRFFPHYEKYLLKIAKVFEISQKKKQLLYCHKTISIQLWCLGLVLMAILTLIYHHAKSKKSTPQKFHIKLR